MTAVILFALIHGCTCDRAEPLRTFTGRHPHLACAEAAARAERFARARYGREIVAFCETTGAPLESPRPRIAP